VRRTLVTPAYCYQAIFHHRTRNLNEKNISSQNGGVWRANPQTAEHRCEAPVDAARTLSRKSSR